MEHKPVTLFTGLLLIFASFSNAQENETLVKQVEEQHIEITSETGSNMKEFFEKFPKSDLDQNGVLTLDEMYQYLDAKIDDGSSSDMRGKIISRTYLKRILKKSPEADLNQDGVLTKTELLEFVKLQKKLSPDSNQGGQAIS